MAEVAPTCTRCESLRRAIRSSYGWQYMAVEAQDPRTSCSCMVRLRAVPGSGGGGGTPTSPMAGGQKILTLGAWKGRRHEASTMDKGGCSGITATRVAADQQLHVRCGMEDPGEAVSAATVQAAGSMPQGRARQASCRDGRRAAWTGNVVSIDVRRPMLSAASCGERRAG